MRIACVNQDPGVAPGRKKGAAVHLAAMRRAFSALGCSVHAVDGVGAQLEAVLDELHARYTLDLVYERQSLAGTAASRFCRRTGVPLFLEVNAPLIEEARAHRGFAPTAQDLLDEDFVLASASELFPVSTPVAEDLARRGVPRAKLHVTPNGVDLDTFRPRSQPPAGLALPRDAFVLGFHGRLRPWHNFALLVEAFALLCARGYPVELVCVGEGDFEQAVPSALRSRVHVRRWMEQDELAQHVACFHALPLSYAADATCYFSPLKLLEAMACGVVPVVPDLGDLPRAVAHGRAGVVVAPGDARALADALAGLIEWPETRERLGRAALSQARQRGWSDVAREVLAHRVGVRVP
ncbi:MAG: glycosyltransferase family 4 protein [Planctomycetes bacterium]|nr:glycosyltransferase family 4 protein [Planctomycetota bacterium]